MGITKVLWIALPWAIALAARAGSAASVDVPCEEVDTDGIGIRDCSSVVASAKALLEQRVSRLASDYYAGLVATTAYPSGRPVATPYCNLTKGKFNSEKAEESKNHKEESCGEYAKIKVHSTNPYVEYVAGGEYGKWEGSHVRGALIQAFNCHYAAVVYEMERNRKLTLSPGCEVFGNDITSTLRQTASTTANLKSQLTGHSAYELSETCDGASGLNLQQQTACHLRVVRVNLEAAFTQLAICEVVNRAKSGYRKIFTDDPEALLADFESRFRVCENECAVSTSDAFRALLQSETVRSEKESCANTCYQRETKEFMEDQLKNWPSDGACKAMPGWLALLFALSAAKARRQPSRPGRAPIQRRHVRRRGLRFALAPLALALATACSDSENVTTSYAFACMGNDGTPLAESCCEKLSCGYSSSSGCTTYGEPYADLEAHAGCAVGAGDDTGDEDESASDGGGNLDAADDALRTADTLLSDAGTDVTTDAEETAAASLTAPTTAAAVDSTGSSTRFSTGTTSVSGTSATRVTTSNPETTSASSKSAAPGSSSGSLLGGGSQPTSSAAASGGLSSSVTSSPRSAVYSGSGGGGSGAGGGFGAFSGGSGIERSDLGGEEREPASVDATDPMASEDPADYFTRVNLEDSLFKIVERKYREKALAWAK